MDQIVIRPAEARDAGVVAGIYRGYVEHTAITFEYEVPSEEEMRRRMEHTKRRYPYLVAERDGAVVGYAYAGPFVNRAAYDWCAELSIYLLPAQTGRGTGKRLYGALEEALRDMGIIALYACVAVPEAEDEYLTCNSRDFHRHMGFREAGRFENCGYKFGRWYHMVWLEKRIGEAKTPMPPVVWAGKER